MQATFLARFVLASLKIYNGNMKFKNKSLLVKCDNSVDCGLRKCETTLRKLTRTQLARMLCYREHRIVPQPRVQCS